MLLLPSHLATALRSRHVRVGTAANRWLVMLAYRCLMQAPCGIHPPQHEWRAVPTQQLLLGRWGPRDAVAARKETPGMKMAKRITETACTDIALAHAGVLLHGGYAGLLHERTSPLALSPIVCAMYAVLLPELQDVWVMPIGSMLLVYMLLGFGHSHVRMHACLHVCYAGSAKACWYFIRRAQD